MIDSHCHLTDRRIEPQVDEVLARARESGVTRAITIGTDLADSARCVELCRGRAELACAVGVHPHEAGKVAGDWVADLRRLLAEPGVVALGEIGLDYHYDFSPRAEQADVFEKQLALAAELRRPMVIHCREAVDDCLAIMSRFPKLPAVFHCFTGTAAEAQRILGAGYYLGFTGVITFKRSEELREVVRLTPMDRLLVETDAPYLAPEPFRKLRVNEPAMVIHVAAEVARVKGLGLGQVDEATTENVVRLFGVTGS